MGKRRLQTAIALWLLILVGAQVSRAQPTSGTLSDNVVIESKLLGYSLQYRVYLPAGYDDSENLPVIYLTDGAGYIRHGRMPQQIDALVAGGEIEPVIAVFVDARDPDNLSNNRRNSQFFCNPRYARFFEQELIPEVDSTYTTSPNRADRVILGLSFGGLNSACFGLMARDSFEGIAMQSPAMHPVPTIRESYRQSDRLPIKIFLSSGSSQDNEHQTRELRDIFESQGYDMKYIEVPFGHSWKNWGPLIDDVLVFYFSVPE
jgi:enterochelin esterase-like enzyme